MTAEKLAERHNGIPSEIQRMTPAEFRDRYHFILSDPDKAQLARAEGLGVDVEVCIGHVLGMRYLLWIEPVEGEGTR